MPNKGTKVTPVADAYSKETLRSYCDLIAKKDKRVQKIIDTYGYPPFWHRNPGFEALVMIILEQQVSLASAASVFNKLKERINKITPKNVLKMTDVDFKFCGFSRQKRTYVTGLAKAVEDKSLNLKELAKKDADEIRKELVAIKGIGNWTVDIYLLSCLHKLDIFPLGDLALIKSMRQAKLITEKDKKEEIIKKTEKFKPYRSILTILIWYRYIKENNIIPPFDL